MKVAVYLSAVPPKAKNHFKREMLLNFARGVSAATSKDTVEIIEDHTIRRADISVVQGWVGMKDAPHLRMRQRIIDYHNELGGHVLVIDSNLLGFLDPKNFNKYLRYSLDGVFPTSGYYFDKDPDPERWDKICRDYDFSPRQWSTKSGMYILFCLQRQGGWSMDGLDTIEWLDKTMTEIRKYTDRPFLIRSHPGSIKVLDEIRQRWPQLQISNEPDIRSDFVRSRATVTYNSSPGVASLLWGVPAYITDPWPERSQAFGIASTDLSQIETPVLEDRQPLYRRLAQSHHALTELPNGEAWNFLRRRLLP